MIGIFTEIDEFSCPMLATAIHHGHDVRPEAEKYMKIDEYSRLREEDPCTGFFTRVLENRLIVNTSRFEVDLNRPPEGALYKTPEQAWGLVVWKDNVPVSVWQYSIHEYEYFYNFLKRIIDRFIDYWGFIIVYDIHSYNHKREGPDKPAADPEGNPDINIGTIGLNRELWADVVDCFIDEVKRPPVDGEKLSIGENIKFKGGYMAQWIQSNYRDSACVISIELKKIFMDEWTGAVDIEMMNMLRRRLKKTVVPVFNIAAKLHSVK